METAGAAPPPERVPGARQGPNAESLEKGPAALGDALGGSGRQEHAGGGIGRNRDIERKPAAFEFPRTRDPAIDTVIVGFHPIDRGLIRVVAGSGRLRMDDNVAVTGAVGIDAGEHAGGPRHHRPKSIKAEAVHPPTFPPNLSVETLFFGV